MDGLTRAFAPSVDGGLINIGDGTERTQLIRIDVGEVTPPVWLRTESGLVIPIKSAADLPFQLVVKAGQMEVLSSEPEVAAWRGNEPAGFTQVFDWDCSTDAPPGGWGPFPTTATITVEDEPTAPRTPQKVLQHLYPNGFVGGTGGGTLGHGLSNQAEIYCAFYHRVSSAFQYHSTGTNKLIFVVDDAVGGGGNPFFLRMTDEQSAGGLYRYQGHIQGSGVDGSTSEGAIFENNLQAVECTRGSWYLVEFRVRRNSADGVFDGEFDLWINGTKTAELTDIEYGPANGWDDWKWDPTWGGNGGVKAAADSHQLDQVYVSGKAT